MNADYKLIDNLLTVGEHFTVNRTSEVQAPGGFLQNVLQANLHYRYILPKVNLPAPSAAIPTAKIR